ncbi:MAG: hypothetical protein LC803_19120 [Acidobacteria bacterium]|nr:hypothetical protein [Acidobacteriota bacterium]
MKKILMIAVAAIFIPWGSVNSSATLHAGSVRVTDSISTIRRRYTIINKSLAKYRTVKKELSGFSAEGGELAAYFDGKAVMKIATINQGETGRSFEDFYYWDEKLIFVFRKQDTYDKPYSGKVARTTENRFYFSDGKLIRWIDENGKQVAPGGGEYQKKQNEYLRASGRFVAGSRSQKTTIEAFADNP